MFKGTEVSNLWQAFTAVPVINVDIFNQLLSMTRYAVHITPAAYLLIFDAVQNFAKTVVLTAARQKMSVLQSL